MASALERLIKCGAREDQAKHGICRADTDRRIAVRLRIDRGHPLLGGRQLRRAGVGPECWTPEDFDWEQSCPVARWEASVATLKSQLGADSLPDREDESNLWSVPIELIELRRTDVNRVLLVPDVSRLPAGQAVTIVSVGSSLELANSWAELRNRCIPGVNGWSRDPNRQWLEDRGLELNGHEYEWRRVQSLSPEDEETLNDLDHRWEFDREFVLEIIEKRGENVGRGHRSPSDIAVVLPETEAEAGADFALKGGEATTDPASVLRRTSPTPSARPASQDAVHSAITAVYDFAESRRMKPPNIKELGEPVRKLLAREELTATKNSIEKLASEAQHRDRRLPPGSVVRGRFLVFSDFEI